MTTTKRIVGTRLALPKDLHPALVVLLAGHNETLVGYVNETDVALAARKKAQDDFEHERRTAMSTAGAVVPSLYDTPQVAIPNRDRARSKVWSEISQTCLDHQADAERAVVAVLEPLVSNIARMPLADARVAALEVGPQIADLQASWAWWIAQAACTAPSRSGALDRVAPWVCHQPPGFETIAQASLSGARSLLDPAPTENDPVPVAVDIGTPRPERPANQIIEPPPPSTKHHRVGTR